MDTKTYDIIKDEKQRIRSVKPFNLEEAVFLNEWMITWQRIIFFTSNTPKRSERELRVEAIGEMKYENIVKNDFVF